jgi:hypothetical protein
VSNPVDGRDPLGDLDRTLAERAADAAIAARTARWWADLRARGELSLAAVLDRAGATGETMVLTTTTGRVHRARVVHVGDDVVVVATAAGWAALAMTAVVSVRPDDQPLRAHHVSHHSPTTMADVMELVMEERWDVTAVWPGANAVTGRVTAVGDGVAVLSTGSGRDRADVLVMLHALSELVVATSG